MRWTHVTYASFRGTAGRGGWKVGAWSPHATREDLQLIAEVSPTHIETVTAFDDFISSEEIDALPRRFEYRPLEGRSLIMQSVPAGKDATGRPGNVFTHAVIDADLGSPLAADYPIALYRSADLLTPFRVAAVNAAELPDGVEEPRSGPMTDLSLSWMMVDNMFGDRRAHLHRLQDVLQAGEKTAVLALSNTNEAAYWIQALSSTLTPNEARRLLHYSTFERAATLPTADKSWEFSSLFVVPAEDRELLAEKPGIVVIDPAQSLPADSGPQGSWARMTAGLYTADFNPDDLVAGLIRVNGNLDSDQMELAGFGDGLARFIRSEINSGTHPLRSIADQHLFGEITGKPVVAAQAVTPQAEPVDILARASEVIQNPRRVLEPQEWSSLRRRSDSRRWISNMSEQAINNIEKLHDSPSGELVSYLDFLLKTELVTSLHTADPHFRSSFSDFPALAKWRGYRFNGTEHPGLRGLLIEAERDARNRPPRGIILDQLMPKLNMDRTLPEISAWLEDPEAQQLMRDINRGVAFHTSRNYFVWDLLRVYFGVALLSDDAIHRALKTLAVDAITRHVEAQIQSGRTETPRRYERFGRDFVRYDAPKILTNDQKIGQYLGSLHQDVINTRMSRNRDVNTIFTLVAEAITKELEQDKSGRELQP